MEIFKPGRPAPGVNADAAACLLIDTDMALDDARAIAASVPTDKVPAIVVTGGVTRAEQGATAAAHLVSTSRKDVRILVGENSPSPTSPDWLRPARESAERLGYLLATTVPLDPPETYLAHSVQLAVRDCATIDVLHLGPWSSFAVYGPEIAGKLRRIVAQGVPPSEGEPPGFNCSYDLEACRTVLEDDAFAEKITWVALPRNAGQGFVPGPDMVKGLATTGLPATIAVMMSIDPSTVADGYIWDDTAALYWLYPNLFARKGNHVEPKAGAEELKENWRIAVNEAIERQN
jgi:inosine-uridine nucleoside N-ribohydrolase